MARVISPTAGTRTEPKDGYSFVRGTTAVFKVIPTDGGVPTKLDAGTKPTAKILAPVFISKADTPIPNVLAEIEGVQVPGQEFEWQFSWTIPASQTPLDTYIVSYQGQLGGLIYNFGDEYFTIANAASSISTKQPAYATADDVRKKKFNIDTYLPKSIENDLSSRNKLIEDHLQDATIRLREELNLQKARGMSENYRLFTIFYAIWSIMLAARGEDGSSVSDSNLNFWRSEWERILRQEKREGVLQGLPMGRG